MATIAQPVMDSGHRPDILSGTPRAHPIDRWIFVFMAAWFIAIVLAGFIPSSLAKIAAVEAGQRPPFPWILHAHAVLMGSFLLLLLAQASLMATGRYHLHRRLGLAAMVLAPALVIAGFILVRTTYLGLWGAASTVPPEAAAELRRTILRVDNIMLLQIRIGLLFPLFLFIGLRARTADSGMHKRMMFLATAMALPAGIDRIPWLPTTLPASPLGPDFYTLVAVLPMFAWDVAHNRRVHPAYWIWLAISLPFAIAVHGLWNTQGWHAMAPRLMGVA